MGGRVLSKSTDKLRALLERIDATDGRGMIGVSGPIIADTLDEIDQLREQLQWATKMLRDAVNTCYGGTTHNEINARTSALDDDMAAIAVNINHDLRVPLLWKDQTRSPVRGPTAGTSAVSDVPATCTVDVAPDGMSIVVHPAAVGTAKITVTNGTEIATIAVEVIA